LFLFLFHFLKVCVVPYVLCHFFSHFAEKYFLQVKQQFLELLQEERLEIVTGGWVMPDEANSIYTSILEQLITGKQCCETVMIFFGSDTNFGKVLIPNSGSRSRQSTVFQQQKI
jgi:hypothetical protein